MINGISLYKKLRSAHKHIVNSLKGDSKFMGRMKKVIEETTNTTNTKRRRAFSPEAREQQLAALAYDLVEEKLRNGTATSQETTYFLKIGSRKEQLERRILEEQGDYLKAKREAIESAKRIEALYADAIKAVRSYQGGDENDDSML